MDKKRIPQVLVNGRYVETGRVEAKNSIGGIKHVPVLRDLRLLLENERQKRKTAEKRKRKAAEKLNCT